ncbi:MAG: single-stranded-DNA-specific exonuclease RecJ [SAR324 cluster bacterium]|nr:single-stranded-DNA-specific exonuclease RecJ [SAR324 cluster bacterium]
MNLSFSQLLWQTTESESKPQQIANLCREMKISPTFAKILINRNLCEPETIHQYLNPARQQCHDPFLMHDMNKAVQRVYSALKRREKVVIYGDYDVDGTAGTVILYRYLKRIGLRIYYFIPLRLKNGYGMTESTLLELHHKKTDLIITIDNGITAIAESRLLHRLGVDLIITDHHQTCSEQPIAEAILNPQKPECPYPFEGLSGTGVAFKFLEAFDQFLTEQGYWDLSGYIRPDLQRDLDLVAFATIADRVPLIDENRYFVREGLEMINSNPRPGLQALIKESNIRGYITPNIISFKLAPKINAVGRLSDPNLGVHLLLSHSQSEARQHAVKLIQINTERQQIEYHVLKSALSLADRQQDQDMIILVNESWHSGVIGSVAAKIAARFQKPTVIVTLFEDQLAIGSIRSVGNFDICSALQDCNELLDKFGGHKAAAGISLQTKHIEVFCKQFRQTIPSGFAKAMDHEALKIEAWVGLQDLKDGLVHELLQMSPFGSHNPEPILGIKKTRLKDITVFGNQHLKFCVNTAEMDMEVFAWDHSDWQTKLEGLLDLAIILQMHHVSHNAPLQFKAIDIKPTS